MAHPHLPPPPAQFIRAVYGGSHCDNDEERVAMIGISDAIPDRILDQIVPEPNSGCWLWMGAVSFGYARVEWGGKNKRAHRVIYELCGGEIPLGFEIDHKCGVRCCVNPDHLDAVTKQENIRRLWAAGRGTNVLGRIAAAKKRLARLTCSNGHHYITENTRYDRKGARVCKQCKRDRDRCHRSKQGAHYE